VIPALQSDSWLLHGSWNRTFRELGKKPLDASAGLFLVVPAHRSMAFLLAMVSSWRWARDGQAILPVGDRSTEYSTTFKEAKLESCPTPRCS
jgi:hypothetical protein